MNIQGEDFLIEYTRRGFPYMDLLMNIQGEDFYKRRGVPSKDFLMNIQGEDFLIKYTRRGFSYKDFLMNIYKKRIS